MDQELREALGAIMAEASEAARAARNAEALGHEALGAVARLRTEVFGSKPPPPPPAGAPPGVALVRRVADSHSEIEQTKEDVEATKEEVDTFRGEVTGALSRLEREIAKQSLAMGIGANFWRWLRTREGKGFAAAMAASIVAAASWLRPAPAPPRVEVVRVESPVPVLSSSLGTR